MIPSTAEPVLFSLLPPSARDRINRRACPLRVSAGQRVFEEGTASNTIFLVVDGRVHTEHLRSDGSVYISCTLGPEDIFCCLPIFDQGLYPATAVAAEDTDLIGVPTDIFRRSLFENPTFATTVLCRLCQKLRQFGCQDPGIDAGGRVATRLLDLVDQFGTEIPLTRRELSELAGIALETSIREVKKFERAGWLSTGRGGLNIKNLPALRDRAHRRSRRGA